MKKLLLSLAAIVAAISVNAGDWYLVGGNYGWSENDAYKFTATSNANEYTLTVAELAGKIKIKEAGTWSTSFGVKDQAKLYEGQVFYAGADGGDITVEGTIANAVITINTEAYTIYVVGQSQENDYEVVYLIGDYGSGWFEDQTDKPLVLKDGTTNTYEGTYALTADVSYIKMKAGNYVYGTGGADVLIELGEEYVAAQSGNAFSLGAGQYTFTFVLEKNADTGVLSVKDGAGVADLEIDNNVSAVYYNLQGVEVAAPEAGLYIVKRGNKVTKEIIR